MKYLSYNTLAGFGDPDRKELLLDFVESINPDVAFFSEAYKTHTNLSVVQSSTRVLEELGYDVILGQDSVVNKRTDQTNFIGIVRRKLGRGSIMQMGHYQGYIANVTEPDSGELLRVGGIHLDDRNEELRLQQLSHLPSLDVLMGDLNAMHGQDLIAKSLRFLHPFTQRLKEFDTDPSKTNKVQQIMSLGQRIVRMADGRVLDELLRLGLQDSDPTHQPTIDNGIIYVQIDHILHTDSLRPSEYTVHRNINLSDHKPISVNLV